MIQTAVRYKAYLIQQRLETVDRKLYVSVYASKAALAGEAQKRHLDPPPPTAHEERANAAELAEVVEV